MNTVLQALNHPIRRDIIARLQNGPMTAGALAEAYDVSKPTMSTHFASLKDADLIEGKKAGVSIIYHLNITVAEEAMSALMGLLGGSITSPQTQMATPEPTKEEHS
ncbi:MAG: transcriptional regulator [Robiginitomaculum sp.]|nr:MAG: transcriptional regulator [Robiginitomaculum sp.]